MGIENPIWKANKDIDVVKKDSLIAMEHHANKQIESLKEQADVLVKQAKEIQERVKLAYLISSATYGFTPVLLKTYYLYSKNDKYTLTLIAPEEWSTIPYGEFVSKVRQLGDSTWEKVKKKSDGTDMDCDSDASITINGS